MKLSSVFALILTVSFCLPALADRGDRRQHRQHSRIKDGVRDGELTRGEALRLRAGQAHVRKLERRAEKDGELSAEEKLRIEKAQDRQNRRIYKEKHDEQSRDE